MNGAAAIPIRTAIPDDIPVMLELERAAGGASHWSAADYRRIFHSEWPVRFALIAGIPPEGFLVARVLDRDWEIENLAVAENSRRRGLGRALVAELLCRARQAKAASVMLEVRRSNWPARALYESCGFEAISQRAAYYHNPPEDAIVYRIVPAKGSNS